MKQYTKQNHTLEAFKNLVLLRMWRIWVQESLMFELKLVTLSDMTQNPKAIEYTGPENGQYQ